MTNYDFTTLNFAEFEALAAEVISAYVGVRVEVFKSGRDAGVDGRFFSPNGQENIIQCKHRPKSTLQQLLNHLRDTEVEKVKRLNPKKYIFVTSHELSRANKREIKNIFFPYIRQDDDVFGRHDINQLLSQNPDIEKKHDKLWVPNINILEHILDSTVHRGVYENSHALLEGIIKEKKCYVHTDNLDNARKKIEEKNSIIITGDPGIGKTTLAKQLCLDYINNEYELCVIKDSIMEASNVYQYDQKQIFYFDDFLGSNCLEALEQRQDSHVVEFIKQLHNSKNKKFILTSRTTILKQGKNLTDRFDNARLEKNEYEISIDTLSRMEKARILYSHIWHGTLLGEQIDEIYESKRYFKIIDHRHYNPRIISFITDSERMSEYSGDSYWENVESILENPKEIWKPVIQNLGDVERHLIICVCLHGRRISEEMIEEVFSKLFDNSVCTDNKQIWKNVMRVLTGTLLNRVKMGDEVTYELFNPSIADYIYENYLDKINYVNSLLHCLQTPEALRNLRDFYMPDEESSQTIHRIFSNVIRQQIKWAFGENASDVADNYKLQLGLFSFSPEMENISYVQELLTNILYGEHDIYDGENPIRFIIACVDNNLIESDNMKLEEFFDNLIDYYACDTREFDFLVKLANATKNINYLCLIKERYISYMKETITELILEDGYILGELEDYMHEEGNVDYDEYGNHYFNPFSISENYFATYIKTTAAKACIQLSEEEIEGICKSIDTNEIANVLNADEEDHSNEFTSRDKDRANDDASIIRLFEHD